ncbi:hypothetical protein J1614_006745 [Plenodomus biglobosus]|nr:hypothetical protein J1614_006745 [Plenodomus biglobosus]
MDSASVVVEVNSPLVSFDEGHPTPNPHSLTTSQWPPQETASTTFKSSNQTPPLSSGTATCAIQALMHKSTSVETASSRRAVAALPKPR